jgi:hypothetical protein
LCVGAATAAKRAQDAGYTRIACRLARETDAELPDAASTQLWCNTNSQSR